MLRRLDRADRPTKRVGLSAGSGQLLASHKADATENAASWRCSRHRDIGRNKMQSNVGRFASAVAVFGATFGWSLPSDAGVDKIVVDQTLQVTFAPIPLNSTINGPAVPYTVYQGRIFGTLDPNDSHNTVITDINLA